MSHSGEIVMFTPNLDIILSWKNSKKNSDAEKFRFRDNEIHSQG